MVPETLGELALNGRLKAKFGELTLVAGTAAGACTYSGRDGSARVAVHLIPQDSPEAGQLSLTRAHELEQPHWGFLPRLVEAGLEDGQLVLAEEWVSGASWSSLTGRTEAARQVGAELFDILDEIHGAGLTCGGLSEEQLWVDDQSRLRLLGLRCLPSSAQGSADVDRAAALGLLWPLLDEQEREECSACLTAAQISRVLRRGGAGKSGGEPPFLGQEQALRSLSEAFPEKHLLTVEGPAGGGKTRLLREWLRSQPGRVLWAKAEREVAPSPFQMFAAPIATLEDELSRRPDLASVLVHELGVELPLLPSLSRRGQNSSGLQRGLLVMFSLMLTVVGRDRPTVLVLDDCQWADPLTLDFLEYWAENGDTVFVIATFRGEEVGEGHPLRRLRCRTLSLPPLTPEQAHQLLLSREPRASQTLREGAVRQAEGNPFSLLSMLRTGQSGGDSELARYHALPAAEQEALAAASVLGREFQLGELEGVLEGPAHLGAALAEGLLEQDVLRYRFPHDRIRDAVLASMHADEVGALHLRAARFLAGASQASPFDVAFHYQAAGAAQEGFPHARAAAELAQERHDMVTVAFYLGAALAGAKAQPAPVRRSLLGDLGDALRMTGRYEEALGCFSRAYPLCGSDVERARLKLSIGDVEFKRGELQLARDSVVQGLSLLRRPPARWIVPELLWQGAIQTFHTYAPRGWLGRREPTEDSTDLLCVDFFNRLAYIRWFLDGPVPSICAHLRELNLAERYRPTRSLARAHATHAIAMGAFPLWDRALRFGASALRMASELGDDWGMGQAGHFYGAALLGASRFTQAREVLEVAVRRLQQTGDRWEENGARYHLAMTYYHQGALDRAAELARETHRVGVAIDDRLAAGDNLFTWARASGGQFPRADLEREKAYDNPDIQRAGELLGAEAVLELRQGRPTLATELLQKAIRVYQSRRAQSMYSAPLSIWLLTAQRAAALDLAGPARQAALKKVLATLKRSLRLAHSYRSNLPHALREQALLLAFLGKSEQACESLSLSLRSAEELGMTGERETDRRMAALWGWEARLGLPLGERTSDRYDWLRLGP